MSDHLFPIIYFNMAAEMVYILEQRLKVQKENYDDRQKAERVLKEVILHILAKPFVNDIVRTCGIPSKRTLKSLFERLAHCSIMRLNENSMDKLFDLMTMAMKFQLQHIVMAEQIMTVTVNHLQGLQDVLPTDPDVREAVEHAFTSIFSLYRCLTPHGWHMLRCGLLQYFQESRVKISMLLREKRQLDNGHFILFPEGEAIQLPKEGEPVGLTTYFEDGKITHTTEFQPLQKFYKFVSFPDALNVPERSTKLGTNMYKNADSLKIQGGGGTSKNEQLRAGNEMALFENILSAQSDDQASGSDFMGMSLFDNEAEEKKYKKEVEENDNIHMIDASKRKTLSSAVEEKIDRNKQENEKKTKKSKGANFLDMLDDAAARPPTAKPKGRRSESASGTPEASSKPRSKSGNRPERVPSAAPKRAASAKRKPS